MKKIILMSTFITALFLSGCASIVNGVNQQVTVTTPPVQSATCSLTNNKGQWFVTTPGSVKVHRSYEPLIVNCSKKGYQTNRASIGSSTKPMAFGNILFGGVVGAAVDVSNGSAYDYPQTINVPLQRA